MSERLKVPFALLSIVAALLIAPIKLHAQAAPMSSGLVGPVPLATLLLDVQAHAALGLSAAQEAQWAALHAAERNLRTQAETLHANLDLLIAGELAKATPDLVAIENAVEAAHQTVAAAAAAITAQAVALYSGLGTAQQAVIIAAAKTAFDRAHIPRTGVPYS